MGLYMYITALALVVFFKVRMEDQVMFASEKTEGQYIHTSSRTYGHVGVTLHENKLANSVDI